MRVAIYARVSTANNGQDPTMQTRELREYAERRGWTVAEYVDVGISGTKENRPELDRLMADAHRRKFDVVAVWKFDRFARSALAPGARHVPNLGNRVCEPVRITRYSDAGRPHGVYGPRRRRGVGALAHRRTREGRVAERAREGQAAWTAACFRGRSQDCHASQGRRVLGGDLPGDRTQQRHGTARPSQLAQKPCQHRTYKCLRRRG